MPVALVLHDSLAAETAYLFRHALLRDAAYQLRAPSGRARLHELAFLILEATFGGRAPEPAPLAAADAPSLVAHATDPIAHELAHHARQALDSTGAGLTSGLLKLYLRRAAEHSEREFRPETSVQAWRSLADLEQGDAQGEALRRAGAVWGSSGRPKLAEPELAQAIDLFRKAANQRAEALALGDLAVVYHQTGRMAQAEQAHERALAISRDIGDRRHEGIALGRLAVVFQETGRMAQAEQAYEQALAIHREVGDRRSAGIALSNLAELYRETGRMQHAADTYARALAIHREFGNRRNEAIALGNLASVHQQTEHSAEAEQTYELALSIHREVGNRRNEGITLGNLALVYFATGRMAQAEQTHQQALAIHREVGNRRSEGVALGNLANIFRDTGRMAQAEAAFEAALAIHREVGNRAFEAACQCEYAICRLATGQPGKATDLWLDGAAMLESLGDVDELERARAQMRAVCAQHNLPPFSPPAQGPSTQSGSAPSPPA